MFLYSLVLIGGFLLPPALFFLTDRYGYRTAPEGVRKGMRILFGILAGGTVGLSAFVLLFGGEGHPPPAAYLPLVWLAYLVLHLGIWLLSRPLIHVFSGRAVNAPRRSDDGT